MTPRHVLFLQGLPGRSFRMLARELRRRGCLVSRVNFHGGDVWDWRFGGHAFRSRPEEFGPWLALYCRQLGITDIVLFGEKRPLHVAAIAVAQRLLIHLHIAEEGYLRPHSVAMEHWLQGRKWERPRTLEECAQRAEMLDPAFEEQRIISSFGHRARDAILSSVWATLLWPLYPRYRTHRVHWQGKEAVLWIKRWLRRGKERRASADDLARLGERPFFLFPLQLTGDAQLVHRSPFGTMREGAEHVLADFAANAPADVALLVKRHPFDPDPRVWRQKIAVFAEQYGITDRVFFVEFADLEALLQSCLGVVCVNSTVGSLALRRGCAVKPLGHAIYEVEGLTETKSLADFWHDPAKPADGAYETFANALWAECLVNGGFHSASGLRKFVSGAADRILAEGW